MKSTLFFVGFAAAHLIQPRRITSTPCSSDTLLSSTSHLPSGCLPVSTTTAVVTVPASTCPAFSTYTIPASTVTVSGSASCASTSHGGCVGSTETTTETSTTTLAAQTVTATEISTSISTETTTETPEATTSTETMTETTTTVSTSVSLTTAVSTTISTRTTVSVSTVNSPIPSTCAQIIVNGDFENPNRQLWPWIGGVSGGASGALGQDFTGSSVFFVITATPDTSTALLQLLQGVSSCAGQYILRFQARSSSPVQQSWTAWVRWDTPGTNAGQTSLVFTPSAGVWTTYQLPALTLPVGAGRLFVEISTGPRTSNLRIDVDNISFSQA